MRPTRVAYGALLSAIVWSGENAAAQECIDTSVERELTSCESTLAPRRPGTRDMPVVDPPRPRAPEAPIGPGYRPPPPDARQMRSVALLEREIQILERLVRTTSPREPRRGDILYRYADALAELATVNETRARELDEPIHRAGDDRAALVRRQATAQQRSREARDSAVRALAELVRDHPTYRRLDEVLFTLAYHLETMQRRDQAGAVYLRLIRDTPDSRFVPNAYVALGDRELEAGHFDDARSFYERVLQIPPERNTVYGYALYKLAWVHINTERWREALEAFVRTIEHLREVPDNATNAGIGAQTRREMILPYMHVGRPDRALAFFRRFGTEDQAIEMMQRLAEAYFDGGQWPNAMDTYRRLIAARPIDERTCQWHAQVLDATISARPKDEQLREAIALTEHRAQFIARDNATIPERACTERVATSLVLLATAWHREAVGTDDQPGTHDRRTIEQAAALYALIDRALPELDQLSFETIRREDRPTRASLAFFRGELLYSAENWQGCAEAYERAIDAGADGQLAADASYGAVLCYDRHLGSLAPPADDEDLTPRELDTNEARMARAFARFACAASNDPELPTVLYRWARLYYEANQFERAATIFRRVAMDHASSEVGEFAANLYLDSMNVLLTGGRTSCRAAIGSALEPIRGLYCNDPAAHPDVCGVVRNLDCEVSAYRAQELGRSGNHLRAGRDWVALAERCPSHRALYLHNGAEAFMAGRLVGRGIRVLLVLTELDEAGELGVRAQYTIGQAYHAMAIYGEAASWYERYARAAPTEPDAVEALHNAAVFRIGLGEGDAAIADARLFDRQFRRTQPARTAQVVFAIGAIHERAENWREVIDHYRGFVSRYGNVASPVEIARAHTATARAYEATGQSDRALAPLRQVIAMHAAGAESSLTGDDRATQLALLRDAVSEAHYRIAESERARFDAITFPALRGRASVARVGQWAEQELRPWMERKHAALRVAEAEYDRVHPLGIPRWRIASASRLGDMVLGIVESVRNAPVPEEIARDEELLAIYWEELDRAAAPYEQMAITRYENCLETATATRWFDDRSRRCEQALSMLDAQRFPIAAELRGGPSYEPRPSAEPGIPLDG
jgi:tetratricopeptide (TPR) repeat protein